MQTRYSNYTYLSSQLKYSPRTSVSFFVNLHQVVADVAGIALTHQPSLTTLATLATESIMPVTVVLIPDNQVQAIRRTIHYQV